MTRRNASPTPPGRAAGTRVRILDAARCELGRDPDIGLAEIAAAAGVSRRTVYGHFAGRAELVEGVAAEAAEAVRHAAGVALAAGGGRDPAAVLARLVLRLWPLGDRYRMLLRLSRQDLGRDRAHAVLAPARETVARILARGQRAGVFHTQVPPASLSRALESHLLALADGANRGIWRGNGAAAAAAALIAVGVDAETAAATVEKLG